MEHLTKQVPTGSIQGVVDGRFMAVAAEFERNFVERGELGASVTVTLGGETVVDLWGGSAGEDRAWERDTVCIVFSCTKGATAICAHVLASRGLLDIEAPGRNVCRDEDACPA